MYAGRTMEYGNARDVFYQPVHPYSIGLLDAVPRLDARKVKRLTIPGYSRQTCCDYRKVARSSHVVHDGNL